MTFIERVRELERERGRELEGESSRGSVRGRVGGGDWGELYRGRARGRKSEGER